ncbi:putative lipoprotein [Treponema primitia ZAS-2]|uniref:Putative lipoprotein n=1 Tax=Treponema primitia (strain ATCC BAA-887 / DSM 12427 / ZAS-2) TaxID=545694 RepID=F5YJR4_TREPZ|nr:Ig-like domain-containing protein [Treponema primitia]AEF85382.1 putative lipoprotein [Treponema primitia ZAS-2]
MYKKLSLVSLAIVILISCENPIQAGLGNKVDIEPPKVNLVSPSPSKNPFIWGTNVAFEINATDDMSVSRVSIIVTGQKPDGSGDVSITKDATSYMSASGGNYLVTLDTLNELGFENLNADVTVRLLAWDGTGKAVVSEELPFRVKNGPPTVEVQTPLKEESKELAEMISGGYLGGVANDDMAVATGWPKIQFWPANGPEPAAGVWSDMDSPYPGEGKKFVNFRYYGITEHPYKAAEKPQGLAPGKYRYRLQVWDGVLEDGKPIHIADYPLEKPDYITEIPVGAPYYELEIIKANEVPKVELTFINQLGQALENPYQNDTFTLIAKLSHSAGIGQTILSVKRAGDDNETILARAEVSDPVTVLDPERIERILKSQPIEPGKPYSQNDTDQDKYLQENDLDDLEPYPFTDGTYEFTVTVTSAQSSVSSQSITVYIDTTPPELDVARVIPVYKSYSNSVTNYTEYTANGLISLDISTYDANNIATFKIEDKTYREIKYLIQNSSPAAPSQTVSAALYEAAGDNYFDKPEVPVYKNTESASSVIIDTRKLAPADLPLPAYYNNKDQYLVLVAKDRAGNYNHTTALLKVEQKTDLPVIDIPVFDLVTIHSEAALRAAANPNKLDTERAIRGVFRDDDGIDIATNPATFSYYKPGIATPFPLPIAQNTTDRNAVSFTVTLPPKADLPDGIYSFEMKAQDDHDKKNALKSAAQGFTGDLDIEAVTTTIATERVYFFLDTEPPVLTEDSLGDSALKVKRASFSLDGTVKDLNGLKSLVIYQQKRGAPESVLPIWELPSIDPTNTNSQLWSLPNLPFNPATGSPYSPLDSAQDGLYDYVITATDIVGHQTTERREVRVDTSAPKLGDISMTGVIDRTAPVHYVSNDKFNIKGEVSDDYRFGTVYYNIQLATYTPPPITAATTEAEIKLLTGTNKFTARAVDGAADDGEWTVTIDPTDPAGINSVEGEYKLYVVVFDAAGNQNNNISPPAPYNTGVAPYEPFLFGMDKRAPALDVVLSPSSSGIITTDFTMTGDVGDTNSLVSLVVKERKGATEITVLTETSFATNPDPIPPSNTWPAFPLTLPSQSPHEGDYTYTITATDVAGRTTVLERVVHVDPFAPQLGAITFTGKVSPDGHPMPWVGSSSFTITGSLSDNYMFGSAASLYYKIQPATGPGSAAPGVTSTTTEAQLIALTGFVRQDITGGPINAEWHATINPSASPISNTQGEYKIYLVVFDAAGNQNNNISPANDPGGTQYSGAAYVPFLFGVDTKDPKLTETTPGGESSTNPLVRKSPVTLGGVVGDTYFLDKLVIEQKWGGGTYTELSPPLAIPLPNPNPLEDGTWTTIGTHNLPALGYTDGLFGYKIIATDKAGRTNTVEKYVYVDNERPKIEGISISTGKVSPNGHPMPWVGTDSFTISGTISDNYRFSSVYYKIQPAGDPPPESSTGVGITAASTEANVIAAGFTSRPVSGPLSAGEWSITIDPKDVPIGTGAVGSAVEGEYLIYLVVFDAAGNQNNNIAPPTPYNTGAYPYAPFRFGVDTHPPVVTETKINTTQQSIQNIGFSLKGKVRDTYGLARLLIEQQKGSGAFVTAYERTSFSSVPVDQDWDSGDIFPFGYAGEEDGNYTYRITVTDIAGRSSIVEGGRSVLVDTHPPTLGTIFPNWRLSSSTPFPWIGPENTDLKITGNAHDDHGFGSAYVLISSDPSLAISDPSNVTQLTDLYFAPLTVTPDAGGNGHWELPEDLTAYPSPFKSAASVFVEGTYYIYAVVFDAAGNAANNISSPQRLGLDASPPVLTEIIGSDTLKVSQPPLTLSGTVTETNLLASLVITKKFGSGSPSPFWNTSSFSTNPPATPLGWTSPALDTVEGNYQYVITLTDIAGRTDVQTRNIRVDNTSPNPGTITLSGIIPPGTPTPYIGGSTFTIGGIVSDNNSLDSNNPNPGKLYYKIQKASDLAPNLTGLDSADVAALTGDAEFTSKTIGIDGIPGKWQETIIPDAAGSVFLDGGSVIKEGEYKIYWVVFDAAENQSLGAPSSYLFGMDLDPPTLSETAFGGPGSLSNPTPTKKGFTLGGLNNSNQSEVGDTYELVSLKITQQKNGGTIYTIYNKTTGFTASPGSTNWRAPNLPWEPANHNWDGTGGSPFTAANPGGEYYYKITATDKAGRTTIIERYLKVDALPPVLGNPSLGIRPVSQPVEHPLPNSWVSGESPQIMGTVTDNVGVSHVFYRIQAEGDPAPSITEATPLTTFNASSSGWNAATLSGTTWRDSVTLGGAGTTWPNSTSAGLTEGKYRIYVVAFDDVLNQTNNVTSIPPASPTPLVDYITPYIFGVDQSKPDLSALKLKNTDLSWWSLDPELSDPAPHKKTRFSLEGIVTDSNGLDTITLTERKNLEAARTLNLTQSPHYPQTSGNDTSWTLNIPNLPWNAVTNPGATVDEGKYSYVLTIKDKTGRSDRSISKEFTIVYDKTGPVITVQYPAPDGSSSITGGNLIINGTASDPGSLSAVGAIYFAVNSSTTPPTEIPPATPWATVSGNTTWNHTLTAGSISEGVRYLHMIGYDEVGNQSSHSGIKFNVDLAPPDIRSFVPNSITVIGDGNYARTGYSFKFDAYDSNKLDTIVVKLNGTALTSGISIATGTDQRKTVTVNQAVDASGHTNDGTYRYEIIIKDVAGKENQPGSDYVDDETIFASKKSYTVVVDTTPPEVSITRQPIMVSANAREDNVNGYIRFSATGGDNNGIKEVKWYLIPHTSSINSAFNPDSSDPTTFVFANSTDVVISDPFTGFPIDIYYNTAALTDLRDCYLYIRAEDTTGLTNKAYLNFYVDQSTDKPKITLNDFPTPPIVSGGYILRGTVSDDDGVLNSSLLFEFSSDAGSTWVTQAGSVSGSGQSVNFSCTIPYGSGNDGDKQLRISVKDDHLKKVRPAEELDIAAIPVIQNFVVDTVSPVLTVDSSTGQMKYKDNFTVTGKVTELHLKTFRARLGSGNWVTKAVASGTNVVWSYTLPELLTPADFSSLAQGPHTITLEAIDAVGLNHEVQWVFYKDTTGPAISFANIAGEVIPEGLMSSGPVTTALNAVTSIISDETPVLRGSFVDEYSDIKLSASPLFQYMMDDASTWTNAVISPPPSPPNPPSPGVTGAGKIVQWSIPLDTLGDGAHRVKVRVWDALENEGTSTWVGFKIAGHPPVLILNEVSGNVFGMVGITNPSDPVLTLTGYATDNSIKNVNIKLDAQAPGTTFNTITAGPPKKVTFTYNVTKNVFELSTLTEGPHTLTVVAENDAGRTTTAEWTFIKDTTPPVTVLSNVETGGATIIMDASPRVLGVTSDTYEVSTITRLIEKSNNGLPGGTWSTFNTTTVTPSVQTTVNWTSDMVALGLLANGDGYYRITVTAKDKVLNPSSSVPVYFRVDRADPVLTLNTIQSYYKAETVSFGGTVLDYDGISAVKLWLVSATGTASVPVTASLTDSGTPGQKNWTASVNLSLFTEGSYTLNVEATDLAGRVKTVYKDFILDKTAPTVRMEDPQRLAKVNGKITIRGTANDNNTLSKIMFKLGKNASTWTDTALDAASHVTNWEGGLYSWNFTIDNVVTYANTTYSYRVDPEDVDGYGIPRPLVDQNDPNFNYWLFPFNVQAIDRAGNTGETIYPAYGNTIHYLLIDPDGDNPDVRILSPENGDLVGGEVRISGIATDDDWIYGVEIRIDPTPDAAGDTFDPWIPAVKSSSGSQVTWYALINSTGDYNPLPGQQRKIVVQARSQDSKNYGTSGDKYDITPYKQITIFFDSEIPVIEFVQVKRNQDSSWEDYTDGMQVSRTFSVRADVRDESGLSAIQWRGNTGSYEDNGANLIGSSLVTTPTQVSLPGGTFNVGKKYLIVTAPSGSVFPGASTNTVGETFIATSTTGTGSGTAYAADGAGNFVYKFQVSVNSLLSHLDTTGYYSLSIKGVDNSAYHYQTQQILNLQVDNFYPEGDYTAPNTMTDDYYIRGLARDYGAGSGNIQGLSHVTVYFSRIISGARTYLPLKNTDTFTSKNQLVKDMTQGGSVTTISSFPANNLSGITIDNNNEVTGSFHDADGDGYVEAWYDNGTNKEWYAIFNSHQLADGPVTLHYVIFDNAGNARYYEKELFVKNNAPKITKVTLGTDIRGLGTFAGGTKDYTANYLTSGFTARNRRLSFAVTKDRGNGAVNYRISHATRASADASTIQTGQIYTINNVGTTNWVGLGAESATVGLTFVAVANGPSATGTGSVWNYTINTTAPQKTGNFSANSASTNYIGLEFNNIPETGLDGAFFIIKVWDTTVPGEGESQQLFDMIVVGLRVENRDVELPTARLYDLNPIARNPDTNTNTTLTNIGPVALGNNMNRGGIHVIGSGGTASKSGHIEPRGTSDTNANIFLEKDEAGTYVFQPSVTTDIVSGKVILRGYAEDNQRISEIRLKFTNATIVTIINTVSGQLTPVNTANAWVYDELTLDGHRVEWAYLWDTQAGIGGTPMAGNAPVQVIAVDARIPTYDDYTPPGPVDGNESASVVNPTDSNSNYNTITLKTAPYISGLTTRLSSAYVSTPSTFDRSALGWYSVREGETVTVRGFNFTGATATIKGTTAPITVTNVNTITLPIAATHVSGPLVVTVGGVTSVNNSNSSTAAYTQEPNNVNNNILTDDRNLYVWNTADMISSADITSPFMRMDASSNWYMSYGQGVKQMRFNKNGTSALFESSYNKYHNTTVAIDSSQNYYGGGTNTDRIQDTITGATSFTFFSRAPGSMVGTDTGNYNTGTNKRRLELSLNTDTGIYNINRVKIPRIAIIGAGTSASPAKIYMSYYDSNKTNNPVIFRYGESTAANTITGDLASNLTDINEAGGSAAGFQVVADSSTNYKGGLYTAVGALSDGRAVIAWYDASAGQLVFSYSTGLAPTQGNTPTSVWQSNARVIDNDFAGWYVDMTVDKNNGIHLAYYANSTGDLRYAYMSSYTATPVVVTVDSYLSAGTKLMINTREEKRTVNGVPSTDVIVPYISYYHASFPQTQNSVRVVWRNNFNALTDGAVLDAYTGAWEAMTIPTVNTPVDEYVCNGVPTGGTFPGTAIDLKNTVMLGYQTNVNYERAYIKK